MRAAVALLLVGCLGPVLPLPKGEPRGAHAWLCVNRACPAEAEKIGGLLRRVGYERGMCGCYIDDARHLPVYTEVPPHPPRRAL